MKNLKFSRMLSILGLFVLPSVAVGASDSSKTTNKVKADDTIAVDYNAFNLRGGGFDFRFNNLNNLN